LTQQDEVVGPYNIDYSKFQIESSSFEDTFSSGTLYVEATKNSYMFIDGSRFQMLVKVVYNPFAGQSKEWDINWNYNTFDFSGKDGSDGSNGFNGSDGTTLPNGDGENGHNGNDGGNGQVGENGKDVNFELAYYNVNGLAINGIDTTSEGKMILLRNKNTNDMMLFKKSALIQIITKGGNGGDGGDGGNGGDGGDGSVENEGNGGNGGNGGIGGNGGKGGDGGDITIDYPTGGTVIDRIDANDNLKIGGLGGAAGIGGLGGQGGDGYGAGNDGVPGTPGSNGSNGTGGTPGSRNYAQKDLSVLFTNMTPVEKAKLSGSL